MMGQPIADFLEAIKAGNLEFIQTQLPDWEEETCPPEEKSGDGDFDFLDDFEKSMGKEKVTLVNTPLPGTPLNMLDTVCKRVLDCRMVRRDPAYLAPITLELIVRKGAWVSDKSLEMMYKPEEYAGFRITDRKVHRFRRTMGLFGSAAFGFNALDQSEFLASQSWANRRLYGIAAVIHSDVPSANIISSSKLLHPNFLERLDTSMGKSQIRVFLEGLADDQVMMNKIHDNHAHRFLNAFLKTNNMEREVCKYAGASDIQSKTSFDLNSLIRRTVLLADDHEEHRLKMSGWLVNHGFHVAQASDGREALEYFVKNQSEIELVLTDFGMPQMDGLNLAIALRKVDSELPIIINTTPPIHPDLVEEANLQDVLLIRKHDVGLLKHAINQVLSK